ncbi:unnamed protein product, partial [Mycena citricolor]
RSPHTIMQVDNPISQPSLFAPSFSAEYSLDLSDIFHNDLFASVPSGSTAASSSSPSSSRATTPSVLTPPQATLDTSFPEIHDGTSPGSLLGFMDEDIKSFDPMSMLNATASNPYAFLSAFGSGNATASSSVPGSTELDGLFAIDPQLVDSPAPAVMTDFEESASPESLSMSPSADDEEDLASTTIVPVKVGGHGKGRKGTVASGGVKKATAAVTAAPNKENAVTFHPSMLLPRKKDGFDDDDDEHELPEDWRPPPEVFQKMTSKEKRQLRNKISARNFRVRRKEYISTLEDNIAERDRLLTAIRAELGSSQSENVALRQEIATLKRTLLENRGPAPVLPPPAPLSPSVPAASPSIAALSSPSIASTSSGRGSPLPTPNTHKDLAANSRFWGGVSSSLGGGFTSVHTVTIPDLLGANPFASSPFASALPAVKEQENLNPALNGIKPSEVLRSGLGLGAGTGAPTSSGDAFGDVNPFTVRNLDSYRMHLWERMAAQYKYNNELPSKTHLPTLPPLTGLASRMPTKHFQSPSTNANSLSSAMSGMSLSGKPSGSTPSVHQRSLEKQRADAEVAQTAMYTAMASQTLLKRLGGAFWDAFSGNENSPSRLAAPKLDADKVRRVLDGTAVLKVVDVDPPSPKVQSSAKTAVPVACTYSLNMASMLEESMRSLSLGKKSQ